MERLVGDEVLYRIDSHSTQASLGLHSAQGVSSNTQNAFKDSGFCLGITLRCTRDDTIKLCWPALRRTMARIPAKGDAGAM
jgi:hypothetical protein